ncbi:MAG: hypothetical protein M1335_00925 [Chloroflexi bacterium]|nr:hypothetical protein [Chloroflexota bacterium]
MRQTSIYVAMTAWVVLGLSAAPTVSALDYEEARAAVVSARGMANEGRIAEAQALAELRLAECGSGLEGAPCRALLHFTLGAFAEMRAGRETAHLMRWANEAIAHYEAILAETPDHAPALRDLSDLHARLGDKVRAEAVLADAFRKHPEDETIAVMLGDFYGSAKRWDKAVAAFAEAAALNSTAELPRRRMVEGYVELLPQRMADLSKLLIELEPTFPSTAELGYREIIGRMYQSDRGTADNMLVRLVSVLARARRLTPQNLDTLPKGWTPTAATELKRYIATPDRMPQASWWLGRADRRNVLAEAALALGQQAELISDPAGAAARWEIGLRIAPYYDDYAFGQLKGSRMVRLDLQTALALHYFKYPNLDPGEKKFGAVIRDLFMTKMGAYAADDLPSIQRHHTILGTIFAQKKVWGRPDQIDGALFQLEHALKAADRRDKREGTYQPLPELRESFAEGLVATGKLDRGRATYVEATQAYLDTDGLRGARRTMQKAGGFAGGGKASEKARMTQLAAVLDTREAIVGATQKKSGTSSTGNLFKPDGPNAWAFGASPGVLDKDFVERQRFKALSDLAERARAAGQVKISEDLALRAFKTAVEGVRFMQGAGDLVRIEKIRKQATQQKVLDARPVKLEKAEKKNAKSQQLWILTDATGGRSGYVKVDQDEILAAKVIGELNRESPAERVDFRVRAGQVVLMPGEKTDVVKRRIEGLPGVKGVIVTPSFPGDVRTQILPAKEKTPIPPADMQFQ